MINKPFDEISKEDIYLLIENEISESKTLEFKQELPGKSDNDKKEFLADVSSFANAEGGDIVYGIKERVAEGHQKTGIADEVVSINKETAEKAKQRIESIIRDNISPRIRIFVKEIIGWGDGQKEYVLLIRISQSFASPHMVTFRNSSRFYSRNSSGKYQLDVGELRTAFLATDSQVERITRFRQDRIGKIVADETPVLLSNTQKLVLHVIPLGPFLNNQRIDLSDSSYLQTKFQPLGREVKGRRYNLDGYLTHTKHEQQSEQNEGYCQLFFNGTVEAVKSNILQLPSPIASAPQANSMDCINSYVFETDLVEALKDYMAGFKKLGIDAPLFVSVILLECKGVALEAPMRVMRMQASRPIDRNTVVLPDILIQKIDDDVPAALKPLFDSFWNAFGYSGSLSYNENGEWKPE